MIDLTVFENMINFEKFKHAEKINKLNENAKKMEVLTTFFKIIKINLDQGISTITFDSYLSLKLSPEIQSTIKEVLNNSGFDNFGVIFIQENNLFTLSIVGKQFKGSFYND